MTPRLTSASKGHMSVPRLWQGLAAATSQQQQLLTNPRIQRSPIVDERPSEIVLIMGVSCPVTQSRSYHKT